MDQVTQNTSFTLVYDVFLRSITDDMFMELNEIETYPLLQDLLLNAIPWFEFPRFDINDYELHEVEGQDFYCGADSNYVNVPCFFSAGGCFHSELTLEEMRILAGYMIVEWIGQQLASIELSRMKYSGTDFKMTSQANHMTKLQSLQKHYTQMAFHLQRLYKRRKKNSDGIYTPTMSEIMFDNEEEYTYED